MFREAAKLQMLVVRSNVSGLHDPPYEMYDGELALYAESPKRVQSILKEIAKSSQFRMISPARFNKSNLNKVHSANYINFLKNRSAAIKYDNFVIPSYFITDTYAPLTHTTYEAAFEAVNIALTGAAQILNKKQRTVYSLCRPPGHHACRSSMGGYCYLNNAAIAASYLADFGKVAILDIDFHHGNGTQDAFYDSSEVLYVSLHADPRSSYPYISGFKNETGRGSGRNFNINYPLPADISTNDYLETLEVALSSIEMFDPDYLIVSAGFDTYKNDPIGGFSLAIQDYARIGSLINALGLPTLIIQEGGYHIGDLGKIVNVFLRSFRD